MSAPIGIHLEGRTAVVIGGTSGIGRTLALGMARAGANVIPTGRREANIAEVAKEIESMGRKSLVHACDAGSRESLDAFRDAVLAAFGGVDILLNGAGQTFRKPTIDVEEAEWNRIMDINVTGMLRACQSFHAPLKASGRGRIVNIASLSSFVGLTQVTAYCASKAAVLSLTRSLAIEWAGDSINVNCIAPGVFPTELNASLLNGTERGREFITRTPMKRFGNPEELVGACILLSSDAASFITGESIAVDGGFLASGVNSI
jgi:NAD(P)-dependent dehydrogenase (short-subunit alcohol dehydrogenase family)